MVGTGPFIFKEWVPGDHVTIVKNPNYWDTANAAHLDQVTFKPIGDSTANLQALQSGGVDVAFSISPLDVKTAQSSGLTIIDRGASCNQLNLDMNQSVGGKATIYANKDVRLAISEAVNKQSYVDAFYAGLGTVPTGFMPPATLGFKAETLPAFDATKAKADLAASGLTGSAAEHRPLLPVQRGPAVHAGSQGHRPGHRRRPPGRGLHRDPQDRGLARRLRQRRHERQVGAVPLRLDLRLGRRRQLPLHRLVRLPGWQAQPAVRLGQCPGEHGL